MLKLSSEAVYWVQRCSTSSFTPATLYVSTSSHRKTGWRNVRWPSKTFAMNAPNGFVHTRIRPKKSAICKIPIVVIIPLELLRTQQGVNQENEQTQRCDTGNDVVHNVLLVSRLPKRWGQAPLSTRRT